MSEPPAPNARREAAIIAAMTLVGAILRFWSPEHLGLNHFDEGIYAFAGRWSLVPKGLAEVGPELYAYAPPLYPILVGVVYLFLGMTDVSAILVSQLCGVLTIPAIAWVARRTFGPGAGAAAAALAAISGPHIAFSRMALTDSTFLLVWTLALGFGQRFLERPSLVRAIPFGLFVGLAQNTKYNGYLAGGIVALAAFWGLVVPAREGRAGAWRAIAHGLIAAVIAGLAYWPWYRFVDSLPGGYAGLIAHHRGYLKDYTAWPVHWRLQMGQSYALSGELVEGLTWGVIAWPFAWIVGTAATGLVGGVGHRAGMRRRLGFVLGAAVYGVAPNIGWWVGVAMAPWWLAGRFSAQRVIGFGVLSMAALTPFYHPYARLWLPLHGFGWMALAGLVPDPRVMPDAGPEFIAAPRWRRLRLACLAAAIGAAVSSDAMVEPRARAIGSPIGPSDRLRVEVARLATTIRGRSALNPNPSRLLVLAPPPVYFYLVMQCDRPIARTPDQESFARSATSRDQGIIESSMLAAGPEDAPLFWQLINQYWVIPSAGKPRVTTFRGMDFVYQQPPTTRLDEDPSLPFHRLDWNVGRLTFYPLLKP